MLLEQAGSAIGSAQRPRGFLQLLLPVLELVLRKPADADRRRGMLTGKPGEQRAVALLQAAAVFLSMYTVIIRLKDLAI